VRKPRNVVFHSVQFSLQELQSIEQLEQSWFGLVWVDNINLVIPCCSGVVIVLPPLACTHLILKCGEEYIFERLNICIEGDEYLEVEENEIWKKEFDSNFYYIIPLSARTDSLKKVTLPTGCPLEKWEYIESRRQATSGHTCMILKVYGVKKLGELKIGFWTGNLMRSYSGVMGVCFT